MGNDLTHLDLNTASNLKLNMNSSMNNDPMLLLVLRTQAGVVIEGVLDPSTFTLTCRWTPPPPYRRGRAQQVMTEYMVWRNVILQEAAQRAKGRVLVVTPGVERARLLSIFDVGASPSTSKRPDAEERI